MDRAEKGHCMSTSVSRPESQATSSHLASHDLVTCITVDRETPWRPRSPLDVPRNPRQVGGVLIRRMTLAELLERNEEAMVKDGRFWYLAAELLETARDGRTIRGRSEGDGARKQSAEYCGEGDGARAEANDTRASISASAVKLLDRVAAELTEAVYDQAEQFAVKRGGDDAVVEPADIRQAAEVVADTGTRRRLRSIEEQHSGNGRGDRHQVDQEPARSIPTPEAFEATEEDTAIPFRLTDQAGRELPATITLYASTPLVAVQYCGDRSAGELVPEHDAADVARRFRRDRPEAVTTIRPVHSRRLVATVVVDLPERSEKGGAV